MFHPLKTRMTLLLNWRSTPYHAPVLLSRALGYYEEEGLQLALLDPHDPSDVTEIVGTGAVDIGLKAMVHCYAAVSHGFPIRSIGTLLHEPSTGFLFLKSSGIKSFYDLRGKRVGYVGRFGKVILDDLAKRAGFHPGDYEAVRIGMDLVDAIERGVVDTGIGIGCLQGVELEERCGEVGLLRIDALAQLGCCCFCSVCFICTEELIEKEPGRLTAFLRATLRGMTLILNQPEKAYQLLAHHYPKMADPLSRRLFFHSLPFFSRTLENVPRDWEKVGRYAEHLGILSPTSRNGEIFTNALLPTHPYADTEMLPLCAV